MRWLRLYTELIDDPKQSQMNDKTFRVFILLLCFARELDSNGEINLPIKQVAWRIRKSQNQTQKAITELEGLSVLSNENGMIRFLNWEKRQFHSDDVTARVQRFRERQGNVSETLHETAPDTDTDTEGNTVPSSLGDEVGKNGEFILTTKKRKLTGDKLTWFKEFWEAFDYKKGRADAADSFLNIPDLNRDLAIAIWKGAQVEARNRPGLIEQGKTPKWAQGWLSGRRWEDEDLKPARTWRDSIPLV